MAHCLYASVFSQLSSVFFASNMQNVVQHERITFNVNLAQPTHLFPLHLLSVKVQTFAFFLGNFACRKMGQNEQPSIPQNRPICVWSWGIKGVLCLQAQESCFRYRLSNNYPLRFGQYQLQRLQKARWVGQKKYNLALSKCFNYIQLDLSF